MQRYAQKAEYNEHSAQSAFPTMQNLQGTVSAVVVVLDHVHKCTNLIISCRSISVINRSIWLFAQINKLNKVYRFDHNS